MPLEIVLLYYCRSILLSVLIRCRFPEEKQHLRRFAVVSYYLRSDLLPL